MLLATSIRPTLLIGNLAPCVTADFVVARKKKLHRWLSFGDSLRESSPRRPLTRFPFTTH